MAKKIDKLTPAQEKDMLATRDRWFEIGSSTERANKEDAESAICGMYSKVKAERPQFLWVRSPKEAVMLISCLRLDIITLKQAHWLTGESWIQQGDDSYVSKCCKRESNPMGGCPSNPVWFTESYDGMMKALSIPYDVSSGIDHLKDPTRNALNDALTWFGSNGAYWIGFYDFMGQLIKYRKEDQEKLDLHIKLAKSAFWLWPYKGLCVVSDRPNLLRWSEGEIRDKRLHRDGGPCLQFRDNAAMWALNGVRVPKWLAESSDSQLDPRQMSEIDNVEVRREFVRKVGIERICKAYNAREIATETPVINGQAIKYRLLELELGNDLLRYLEMENPSLEGILHVERVDGECKTVRDAMRFRNSMQGVTFAANGRDWYQHGDVVIVPKGAKRLKPWPSWIA